MQILERGENNSGVDFLMEEALTRLIDIEEYYEDFFHNELKGNFTDENILIIICCEILKNKHDIDFIESVINNSIQNNIHFGVDLNKVVNFNGNNLNIFLEIIKHGNIDLFRKISTKIRFIKLLDIGLLNSFKVEDSNNLELEKNKIEIFEHLMFYGLDKHIDEGKIIFLFKNGNLGILESIYEYDKKKDESERFFSFDFLEKVFNNNIENKEILSIIEKKPFIETFLTEKYYNQKINNAVDNTYDSVKTEISNGVDASNEIIRDKIIEIVTSKENIIELAKFILDNKFEIISKKVGEKLSDEYLRMLKNSDNVLDDFSDSLFDILTGDKSEEFMKLILENLKNKRKKD